MFESVSIHLETAKLMLTKYLMVTIGYTLTYTI